MSPISDIVLGENGALMCGAVQLLSLHFDDLTICSLFPRLPPFFVLRSSVCVQYNNTQEQQKKKLHSVCALVILWLSCEVERAVCGNEREIVHTCPLTVWCEVGSYRGGRQRR